jgi:hypothetical protein
MNKFIIIFAIFLSNCTTENQNGTTSEPIPEANCRCNTILEANVFRLPTGQSFTAGVMENDCSTVQKNFNLNGVYRVGQKICN